MVVLVKCLKLLMNFNSFILIKEIFSTSASYNSLVIVLSKGSGARYIYSARDVVTELKIKWCPFTCIGNSGF